MSLGWILEAAVDVFAICLLITRGRPIWRNEIGLDTEAPPPIWPYGPTAWRSFVRIAPLGIPIAVVVVPYDLLQELVGPGSPVVRVVEVIVAPVGILVAVLLVTVFLFNWPKQVVAPHLRGQPGAIAGWRGAPSPPVPPPARGSWWQHRPAGTSRSRR